MFKLFNVGGKKINVFCPCSNCTRENWMLTFIIFLKDSPIINVITVISCETVHFLENENMYRIFTVFEPVQYYISVQFLWTQCINVSLA